jgi:hypothetical protein
VLKTPLARVGQFLLGCKCPVSRGIVMQEQENLGEENIKKVKPKYMLSDNKIIIE